MVRIMSICVVAAWFGQQAATGYYHDYSGYVVFLVGVLLMVQAGEWTQYLGRLDLVVEQGTIVSRDWRAIPINAKKVTGKDAEGKDVLDFVEKEIPADPEVTAALSYFLKLGAEKLAVVVGETDPELVEPAFATTNSGWSPRATSASMQSPEK